jgi:hypothetical protein
MVADMKNTVFWDITSVKLFYEEDRRLLQNMSAYL